MSTYNDGQGIVSSLSIGEHIIIAKPDNIKLFRKNLWEISTRTHKKFTTKVKDGNLVILRVQYYSIAEQTVK